MVKTKQQRLLSFLAGLLILTAAALSCFAMEQWEQTYCTGEYAADLPQLGQERDRKLYLELEFEQQPVAMADRNEVLFLSIDPGAYGSPRELAAGFRLPGMERKIYLTDVAEDLREQIRQGQPCGLVLVDEQGDYERYDVVLTTLPVLSMKGRLDEKRSLVKPAYAGDMRLWSPAQGGESPAEAVAGSARWNVRGGTSSYNPKKPWKLDLVKKDGSSKSRDLLGLGSDDDWILNPMNMEDTKIREAVFMDLWNTLAEESDHITRMSTGKYVELILDGRYHGLYLLQRRLDENYLELDPGDILMKGLLYQENGEMVKGFDVRYSVIPTRDVDAIMEEFWEGNNPELMDRDNLMDTCLFLAFATASDNARHKNMYYILRPEEEGYRMELLPWDTDMSFGVTWSDEEGFIYNYDTICDPNKCSYAYRMEYKMLQPMDPELDRDIAARWQELRRDLFTREHVLGVVDAMDSQLVESGARDRDILCWGQRYGGADTMENLRRGIAEKLDWMDGFLEAKAENRE